VLKSYGPSLQGPQGLLTYSLVINPRIYFLHLPADPEPLRVFNFGLADRLASVQKTDQIHHRHHHRTLAVSSGVLPHPATSVCPVFRASSILGPTRLGLFLRLTISMTVELSIWVHNFIQILSLRAVALFRYILEFISPSVRPPKNTDLNIQVVGLVAP
jgi:hypothetical protein